MDIKLNALVQVQLRGMWCDSYRVIALPAPSKTGKARVTVAKVDSEGRRVMKGRTMAKAITVTADKIR